MILGDEHLIWRWFYHNLVGPRGGVGDPTLWPTNPTFPWNLLKQGDNIEEGARRNIPESLRWYMGERWSADRRGGHPAFHLNMRSTSNARELTLGAHKYPHTFGCITHTHHFVGSPLLKVPIH
jgi:GTP-dependent phosphoenolpyruvate carboxykinase